MIAIGSDHAAAELRKLVKDYLENQEIPFTDCGTDESPSDYPLIARKVCTMIQNGEADSGILLCGTGIGMSMAANKHRGIRAAACSEPYSAKFTRLHNNANVLCMGARVVGSGLAQEILDAFLFTEFEGGRHQKRIDMITEIEQNESGTGGTY
ncbi:MAG: ribose 5-phosphate isomerase B [Oscillospiraceae bacterium]|nr:ribose 5-phosphate isomerase B [Oscillospiraceae bacterium]